MKSRWTRILPGRSGRVTPDFSALMEHAPCPLLVSTPTGQVVASNAACRRLMGHPDHSLEGLRVLDLVHIEDCGHLEGALSALSSAGRDHVEIELRWMQENGNCVPCRATVFVSQQDEASQPLRVFLLDDMTEVVHAREARSRLDRLGEMQDRAFSALAGTGSTLAAIDEILATVGAGAEWQVGVYWAVDTASTCLRCSRVWKSSEAIGKNLEPRNWDATFAPGEQLPGRVWLVGRPEWLFDLSAIEECTRYDEGVSVVFAFPVLVDGDVHGVFEFQGDEGRWTDAKAVERLSHICARIANDLASAIKRERLVRDLEVSQRQFETVTEVVRDAILTIDDRACIIGANAAAETIFGYTRNEITGRPLEMLLAGGAAGTAELKHYIQRGNGRYESREIELAAVRKGGEELLLDVSLAEFVRDGRRTFTAHLRDVTERKQQESALIYQALHDSLTDLPNRTLLQERLQQSINVARRHRTPLALLIMDLDRFIEVNDTFGHHSGDMLLKEVARRLQHTLRESDTIARLGGDEFAALLPGTDEVGAVLAAGRIIEGLLEPFTMEGQVFEIAVSIGIAVHPDHGADSETLLHRADTAMYAAKRMGTGYTLYSADEVNGRASRLLLTSELRRAIEQGQLILHYQPKVDLLDGRATQVEALVRWRHPERGLIAPDAFIPLAEQTGLIKPLTMWVLHEALDQQREWRDYGLDLRVAVNFSARTLHDAELVGAVSQLLAQGRVDPSRVEIEITESAIMIDPARALDTLSSLRRKGVHTSIDDFGTGYSSLGYLKTLPVDEIKIDRSFVKDMAVNRDDASIVRSVVTLAHNLGLQVVAEGVDNQHTLDMLSAMKCHMAQGYYLSRPLPVADITPWLRSRARETFPPFPEDLIAG